MSKINFKLNSNDFQKQISDVYKEYKWTKPEYKNECVDTNSTMKFELNNTQKFVKDFVKDTNPNGILLYHSVGAGKTLSAIALAKKFYDEYNYTTLWVTRTTLRKDIEKGLELLPVRQKINPISYKQFSNIAKKRGENYNKLLNQKGSNDILRNTLLIIDEAHKLYTKDLKPQEMHDIKKIQELIFNSYDISGNNAVKVVLMTATPITEDPIEFIQLANLIIEDPVKRFDISKFREKYLDQNGKLKNKKEFQEKIKDLVSYIDLSRDPRKFTQVKYTEIFVPMSIPLYNSDFTDRLKECKENRISCKEKLSVEECSKIFNECKKKITIDKKDNKTMKYQSSLFTDKCKLKF
jgi:superfamily II DNA or RNA helicase